MLFPHGEGGSSTRLKMSHVCPSTTSLFTQTEGPVLHDQTQLSNVLAPTSLSQDPVQRASFVYGCTGTLKKRAREGPQAVP
jgi:hypothetical protein